MGCCTGLAVGLVKYILFFANILFVLCGVGLIVVGAMAQANFTDYDGLLHGKFSTSAIAVIVLGAIIFLIAFFGCCGAIQENRCMLQTYGGLILCIFIAQMGLGIWALSTSSSKDDIITEDNMVDFFKKEFDNKYRNSSTFDFIQDDLHCCGVKEADDYKNILSPPIALIPDSCCPKENQGAVATCNSKGAYKLGCYEAVTNFLDKVMNIIGIVAICIAGIEVLAIVFAFCLAGRYRD